MDSKKPIYKSKIFWILFLFLLYSALGFFAVPYFIKKEVVKVSINQLNSDVIFEDVGFNPFTISANLKGVELTDKTDTKTWLKADNILVNVNLWRTLFEHLNLDNLQINNPHYFLVMENNDSSRIKYPKLNTTDQSSDESEFKMDIALINIIKGKLNFKDISSEKQINLDFKEILFHHDSFTTLDNENKFSLSFITSNDEKANIDGQFNIVHSSFDLNWNIDSYSTETVFHLIGDNNNSINGIKNKTGSFNANGSVKTLGIEDKLPSLTIANFKLTDFVNDTTNDQQLLASIPELSLTNTDIDLNNQSITIESIDSETFDLSASFDQNSHFIYEHSNESEETDEQSNDWTFLIKTINANNSLLKLNKSQNNQINTNELAFKTLQVSNLTNLENQKTTIIAKSIIDSEGAVDITSNLNLVPFKASNTVKIEQINLSKWQAWVPSDIKLELKNGLMSLEQNLIFENDSIVSNGWYKFNNLELLDQNKQLFFSITKLDLQETTIDSVTKKISLNSIIFDNAKGDLIVSEDKQLNINNLVSESTPNSNKTPTLQSNEKDWIIDIKEIELIDAKTNLIDKSIRPNFKTELSKFNGKIKGLSSDNLSKADVNLSGLLDTYGKLKVNGQINPLSDNAFTDVSINIENLDLQNLSSYSGQFLGFPITRGKVDFELNYKLNQSILKGINDLSFKQLQFGDKTDSKDAVSLPLKLAVGLLTDGNGIMKINLPVSGNIDDPEFSYGGLVFKAFFKLITGIVASPFKLLGKLIPGGPDLDLSGIQFQPGKLTLKDQERVKLDAMKKILEKRPGILLELSGVVNTTNDSKAIKTQQLLSRLNLDEKPEFTAEYSSNNLKSLYFESFGSDQWQTLQTNATKDETLNNALLAENAWNELLENENIEGKLTILAKDRSLFIQAQLIEEFEISEDKIFIKPNELSEDLYPQVKFGVGQ